MNDNQPRWCSIQKSADKSMTHRLVTRHGSAGTGVRGRGNHGKSSLVDGHADVVGAASGGNREAGGREAPGHDRDDLAATVVRGQCGAFGQDVARHAGTPFLQEDKALLPPMSFCGRGSIFAWDVGFCRSAGALRTISLTRWE